MDEAGGSGEVIDGAQPAAAGLDRQQRQVRRVGGAGSGREQPGRRELVQVEREPVDPLERDPSDGPGHRLGQVDARAVADVGAPGRVDRA